VLARETAAAHVVRTAQHCRRDAWEFGLAIHAATVTAG
jgi:hypothetical protein